jgi:serine/threonine-protein kinase
MAATSTGGGSSILGDRYRIGRELGRGGMATVFLARDEKHDRAVAVKVMHPEVAAALGAERFAREIAIAAQLQHPHIVALIDSGATEEPSPRPFYVMPFVTGSCPLMRLSGCYAR